MTPKKITISKTEKGLAMSADGFTNSEVIGLLELYKTILLQREISKFKRKVKS